MRCLISVVKSFTFSFQCMTGTLCVPVSTLTILSLEKYRLDRFNESPFPDTIQHERNCSLQNLFLWETIWTWLLLNDLRLEKLWHLWRSYTWELSKGPKYNTSPLTKIPSIITFHKTALCKIQLGVRMLQQRITFICYRNLRCAKLPKCLRTLHKFIRVNGSHALHWFKLCCIRKKRIVCILSTVRLGKHKKETC